MIRHRQIMAYGKATVFKCVYKIDPPKAKKMKNQKHNIKHSRVLGSTV